MTSLTMLAAARKRDWIALPWQLMGAGLLMCLIALLLTRIVQGEPAAGRILLLAGGLLSVGIALAVRLNSNAPAFLDRLMGPSRALLLQGLAGMFLLIALTAVAIFIATFFDLPWLPWSTGMSLYLAVVAVPLSLATAYRAQQLRRQGRAVTVQEETALLLLLAALCCFVACWALYLPDDPFSWDSIRMALAVFTIVALIAAPLALASTAVRRWTISVLVVLHFSAIGVATLSAPPTPWVVSQLWLRIYRPYLEFMYLNNAYHFYAPEPGPASYLWCRLSYVNEAGNEQGAWYKVPKLDDKTGRHQHQVALEYQRHISLIENCTHSETTSLYDLYTQQPLPFFIVRQQCTSPVPVVGRVAAPLAVPFHPNVPVTQQYSKPNTTSRRLLASFVRHIAKLNAERADLPGYKLEWIKVYRVRHEIPLWDLYGKLDPPLSANDPILYRPFYMGRYDTKGILLDEQQYSGGGILQSGDPFLYWLLPIVRVDATQVTKDYCRLHAEGQDVAQWQRLPNTDEWITEDAVNAFLEKKKLLKP